MNNLEKLENFDKWLAEYNCEDVYSLAEKLQQCIAELETKLEEVEGQYAYECECNKQLVELQEENAKLQEQLKNVCCPKYKIEERKWYIERNPYCNYEMQAFSGDIIEININTFANGNIIPAICYKFDTSHTYVLENEIFATEAEAQKYLEEHK